MRRWTRRIIYGLLILIFVALAAIQVVLWTDWPRRLVLSLVQQQLGLRVEASGLSTGWMGSTTLRDVKLSLPLAGESFLDMPTMTVRHTALLPLLITRDFDLRAIELNKPNLVVRRDSGGHWNLQDVAELVARATAGTPAPGTREKPPKLPTFRLTDGTIAIIDDAKRQRVTIAPLTASGDPQGPLVWRYNVGVPERLQITGQVAPGEDFKHEFRFSAKPRDWLDPWIADLPAPLSIDGQWTGILANKKTIVGRLVLEDSQVAKLGARGKVAIQTSGDDSIITPQNLVITTSIEALPKVEIASGTIQMHGTSLTMQQIRLGAVGGLAQLDGSADLAAKTAEISGVWQELALPGHITHSGNINLSVKNLFPSRPSVTGSIVTRGKADQGAWDGQITLEGAGRTWDEMDWVAKVPRVDWKAKLPIEVADVIAKISQRGQVLTLTELHWPSADRLSGRGELNLREKSWFLRVRGGGTLNKLTADQVPFDFNIDTYGSLGDVRRVHLNEVFCRARNLEMRATGDYVSNVPEPVSLSLYVNRQPSDRFVEEDLPIRGKFLSEGHVGGTLDPLHLVIKGVVRSDNLVVLDRPFGTIRGNVSGNVETDQKDSQRPTRSSFVIADMSMLGGAWKITSTWPYDEKDKMADTDVLRVEVNVDHLALGELGDLLKTPGVNGQASGKWTIDITKLKRDLLAMRGSFSADNVSGKGVIADRVTGQMSLRNGVLRVEPIELHRQEKGVATASFETTLSDLHTPTLQFSAQGWPVALAPGSTASAALWADANLQLDTKTKGATGPIKARAMFATTQQAIGEATVEGKLDGRTIALDSIKLTGFGGAAEGSATLNGQSPNQSTAALLWNNIDGERIADLLPQLKGLAGRYSGALTVDPAAASERPLEPLRVRLELNPDKANFRTVAVGPAKLSAFLNLGSDFSLQRIVLDELPSEDAAERAREAEFDAGKTPATQRTLGWNDFRIADGRLKLWARRGRHSSGEEQTHIIADFAQLDLNQMVHAFNDKADPMPGRLGGQIIVHGDLRNRDGVFADGRVRITDSDLGKTDVLETLYNLMSLGTQPKEPNGGGSLQIQLQRSTLTLNNIHYFNRGAEAWSSNLTIQEIWKMPNSPIEGYVVGSARPLSAIKLPLLADVDQILTVLQSNLTTVSVQGTVGAPKVKQGTFSEVGSGLKRFLTGQINETRGAPPPAR